MVGAVWTKPENYFSKNDVEGHHSTMKNITLEFNRYLKAFISITENIANNYNFMKENVYRVIKDLMVDWDLFTLSNNKVNHNSTSLTG